jgi:hypothetical protein
MRQSQAFRPAGPDRLETREVPSAVVFTGLEYKHLIRDIDLQFKHFAADYGYAIHRVPLAPGGTPSPAAVSQFFTFVNNRSQELSNQLYDMAHHRVPFGQQGLGQQFQAEVATMDSSLTSVTTVQEALHPGSTIDTARRAVLSDLGTTLVAQLHAHTVHFIES